MSKNIVSAEGGWMGKRVGEGGGSGEGGGVFAVEAMKRPGW